MVIFSQTKTRRNRLSVYWGDLLGTTILVIIALVLAFVLHFIPSGWLLGLLGLIPIWMGIKLTLGGGEDDNKAVTDTLKSQRRLFVSVALITLASGSDNIGVYVPLFVTLTMTEIIIVLITFWVMLTLFCVLGYCMVKLPVVARLLEEYGQWITAAVYILLGLYIMWEVGTFQHLMTFI